MEARELTPGFYSFSDICDMEHVRTGEPKGTGSAPGHLEARVRNIQLVRAYMKQQLRSRSSVNDRVYRSTKTDSRFLYVSDNYEKEHVRTGEPQGTGSAPGHLEARVRKILLVRECSKQ